MPRRSPRRELGCKPLIAQALGPRRGDKPQCSLNPSHKDTNLQWSWKFLNGTEKFWNGYNSRKRRLLRVLFFRTWSKRSRQVTEQKACAFDVRKAPIRDLLISIHKTRGFEWQTAHTKGCQENRCGFESRSSPGVLGNSSSLWTMIHRQKKLFTVVSTGNLR